MTRFQLEGILRDQHDWQQLRDTVVAVSFARIMAGMIATPDEVRRAWHWYILGYVQGVSRV